MNYPKAKVDRKKSTFQIIPGGAGVFLVAPARERQPMFKPFWRLSSISDLRLSIKKVFQFSS